MIKYNLLLSSSKGLQLVSTSHMFENLLKAAVNTQSLFVAASSSCWLMLVSKINAKLFSFQLVRVAVSMCVAALCNITNFPRDESQ